MDVPSGYQIAAYDYYDHHHYNSPYDNIGTDNDNSATYDHHHYHLFDHHYNNPYDNIGTNNDNIAATHNRNM